MQFYSNDFWRLCLVSFVSALHLQSSGTQAILSNFTPSNWTPEPKQQLIEIQLNMQKAKLFRHLHVYVSDT